MNYSLFYHSSPLYILSNANIYAREFSTERRWKCVKKVDFFTSHNPLVTHLSHSTQSNYKKPQNQNIKIIVVAVTIFGHNNVQSRSLQNRHRRSRILIS